MVSNPAGQLNVLVSSAGSDNIYVFGQETEESLGGGSGVVTAPAPPVVNSFEPPTLNSLSTTAATVLTSSTFAASSASTSASASSSSATSSSSVSAASATSVGLSLGTFSSLGNTGSRGSGGALLVAVEGNSYLSVPILDFGAESSAGQGGGEERMPWLSGRYSFGDTSALTRFVIGLDDALERDRGSGDASRAKGLVPRHDPWSADLFQHHLPTPPPAAGRPNQSKAAAPAAAQGPRAEVRVRLGEDEAFDQPRVVPVASEERIGAGFLSLAGVLLFTSLCAGAVGPHVVEGQERPRSCGGHAQTQLQNPTRLACTRAKLMSTVPAAAAAIEPWVQVTGSPRLWTWLADQQISLAFTTYQSGKLFLLGRNPEGRLAVFERTFNRAMGLWADGQALWLSTLFQVLAL